MFPLHLPLSLAFLLAGWEVLRFLLLYAAVTLSVPVELLLGRQAPFWIALLGSPNLLLAAAWIFLALDDRRNAILRNLLKLAKALALVIELPLILMELSSGNAELLLPTAYRPLFLPVLAGIAFLDLTLLGLLLSYKETGKDPESAGLLPEIFKEMRE